MQLAFFFALIIPDGIQLMQLDGSKNLLTLEDNTRTPDPEEQISGWRNE
jgi:hypothetical protein